MNDVILLSSDEEKKLTNEELLEYYNRLKKWLLETPYNNFTDLGIKRREKLNLIVKKILDLILKYEILVDGYENIPEGAVIYASSHQDFYDVINSIYAYPEHALTLNASNVRQILKMLLSINGAIFINRDSKESRKNAKIEMMKALMKGKSVNMYPEATLNCTPSKLHLPFFIGMIDIAQKTGVPVVPVVQEYTYDQSHMDGKSHVKSVHIKMGRPIYVLPSDDKYEKLAEFDEVFSTMRWELIEEKGKFLRSEIDNDLYVDYIKARINDWRIPNNDIYEERKQIYKSDDDFYLFHHVNDVDFDEDNNLLQTEYVRKLNKINRLHL